MLSKRELLDEKIALYERKLDRLYTRRTWFENEINKLDDWLPEEQYFSGGCSRRRKAKNVRKVKGILKKKAACKKASAV